MEEFETEAAAKRYAKDALNSGLRVEASRFRDRKFAFPGAEPQLGRRQARLGRQRTISGKPSRVYRWQQRGPSMFGHSGRGRKRASLELRFLVTR